MKIPHFESTLNVQEQNYVYADLRKLADNRLDKLPMTLKVLLENMLRLLGDGTVVPEDIEAVLAQTEKHRPVHEIAFMPARVLLQDFTGVPAIVDLAAMRDALATLGGNPEKINPLQPVELVVDHSIQVDDFGKPDSNKINADKEFQRNEERYGFLKWGQQAFSNFKVVPPDTGIVHQVNLEYLARVIFTQEKDGKKWAYPDTLVGTDSHTPMVNGLGVLGWGVGGIEAEAAMLGQPVSMLIPEVIGFEFSGHLREGTTATDLVLVVTHMLRHKGVVGKFVEFYGDGLEHLPVADRATIGNMAPEYGATCGFFPIDNETLRYLELTSRPPEQIALVEAYAKAQGLWREKGAARAVYADTLSLDLSTVEPSLAGPKRPQDRILLKEAKKSCETVLKTALKDLDLTQIPRDKVSHGSIVIAAITSCTNTSNPAVMLGAGLVAKKANEKGLTVPKWVKTSLAPGSRVVTDYLVNAELLPHLEALGFYLVGYGCTTCIGNSGPLPEAISHAVQSEDLYVCAVLSGNRNFEGRIHPDVRLNYLTSPLLVVAYAIAGRMDVDLVKDPLGKDKAGHPVYLKDIWPSQKELQELVQTHVKANLFKKEYAEVYKGDIHWNSLHVSGSSRFEWNEKSTYVQNPPYFEGMSLQPSPVTDIIGARCLVKLGDSVTTDHISPAGSIKVKSPAGQYLLAKGVKEEAFNSYGARRGNHEVMMRGTFANVRLKNQLAPGTEGCITRYLPDDVEMSIYDAAMQYQKNQVPLVILAGKEYGSGSSRDWAAKGPRLLGVRAVIAESFERIHRSNLIGMGILPLEFEEGQNAEILKLTGREVFEITKLKDGESKTVTVVAHTGTGESGSIRFTARVRLDTPQEVRYYQNGGILHYVLRQLAG